MFEQTITQGNPLTLFYYIRRNDNTPADADDFIAIDTTVTNLTTSVTNATQSVEVAVAMQSPIVTTDPRYRPTNDAPGYNAEVPISGDEFEAGECQYDIEVRFTPIDGEPFTRTRVVWCEMSPAYERDHGSSSSSD